MARPSILLAASLLLLTAGCDSAGSGSGSSFVASITGARTASLAGPAAGGPVTRAGDTFYELTFSDLPAGQILLAKRSLAPLVARTYTVGDSDESFSGIVALSNLPYDFATFATSSGSVTVDRVAGQVVDGSVSMTARSFDGEEEVRVEGTFRIRLPD